MPKTETVLISLSIIVKAPVSETLPAVDCYDPVQEAFLDAIAERLRASLPALKQETWFVEDAGVTYYYLSAEDDHAEKNAGRCTKCGRWTSDYNAPNFLDLLLIGKTVAGELLCDACLPDSVGRRYLSRDRENAESETSTESNQ